LQELYTLCNINNLQDINFYLNENKYKVFNNKSFIKQFAKTSYNI